MRIVGLSKEFYQSERLRGTTGAIHPVAEDRLKKITHFDEMVKKTTAEQAAKWCQQSTSTLYEWKQRYAKHGYAGLIPGSRRPKRVRQSSLTKETVQAFIKLRTSPEGRGLGGRKLAVMLQREGHQISLSQGDRLVSRLLADRKIVPARHWGTKRVKRKHGVHVKPPKPQQPGDLVQIDTLHVQICPGQTAYQFSAVDCVTRYAHLKLVSSPTSAAAAKFLAEVEQAFPFTIRGVQTDGGSEFCKDFTAAIATRQAAQHDITHYVLPPRSPKLNGIVERFQGSCRQEFWRCVTLFGTTITEIRPQLQQWLRFWCEVRPHQALHYRTPTEVLAMMTNQAA